jgi:hypothetical protein
VTRLSSTTVHIGRPTRLGTTLQSKRSGRPGAPPRAFRLAENTSLGTGLKLLLFIKDEVAARAPRQGARLVEERKQKAAATAKGRSNRQKGQGAVVEAGSHLIVEGDDDEDCSEVVLMYNTVRGYVSAIKELWAYQTSKRLHNAPQLTRVALKALENSIVRGEHARRRGEFTDRGISTFRDGYLPSQIPDLHRQVWSEGLVRASSNNPCGHSLTSSVVGNSMLLRLSNRLPMEHCERDRVF